MRRGVITISPAGLPTLNSIAEQLGQESELSQRLQSVSNQEAVTLELSEDTAEQVLDRLPVPSSEIAPEILQLRQNFSAFLTHMRFPDQEQVKPQ